MSKWIKRKLMSFDEFEATFRPICDYWEIDYECGFDINYGDIEWYINEKMFSDFGSEIEVRKIDTENYTYEGRDNWCYHELWFEPEFEPIEFIKEEEMMIE